MKQRTAILLINLGTPRSPTLKSVFYYLNEFLTDPRVIDLPWWRRQLLVRGLIVPSRLKQSTHSYKQIWTKEGSPLLVYGLKVKEKLQEALGENFLVELAMRYQRPSIEQGLEYLMNSHPEQLIILPLFPQYASATTGSVHQKVMELLGAYTTIPQLRFVSHFAHEPSFHEALAVRAKELPLEKYDHILFSYHGLPQRHIVQADPSKSCLKSRDCCQRKNGGSAPVCYRAQCFATTSAVVERLRLDPQQYSICFQSRLGKEPWLEPYASDRIAQLAREGKKKVLVFCPSFVCDCLETLFEIGEEYGALFKAAGGQTLDLAPGLNDHPSWISALKKICLNDRINLYA